MEFNAIVTNMLTDALNGFFLSIYFSFSLWGFLKNDRRFSLFIVMLFLTFFALTVLGAYAHFYSEKIAPSHSSIWVAISLLIILLNYFVAYGMQMPDYVRMFILCLSVFSSFLFITGGQNYTYLALPLTVIYLIAALYSRQLLRIGFALIVCSNLFWLLMRNLINYYLGFSLPIEDTYDNDLYHFMLIGSTFIIFLAILRGQWPHPKSIT